MERLDEAVELGINMVDTADAYGGGVSEQAVGRWLRSGIRPISWSPPKWGWYRGRMGRAASI